MGLFGKKKDGAAVQVKKLGFEVNSNGKAIRVSRIISTRNDAFFSLSQIRAAVLRLPQQLVFHVV